MRLRSERSGWSPGKILKGGKGVKYALAFNALDKVESIL